ncbi:S1C family serine protease [Granulosicoccus sp. 3-233]|uniref:S1C family serine protease n=1 Tax=Granulosicoccus sp. 3-233 TaxID=3417969 RepID=UPI003D334CE3
MRGKAQFFLLCAVLGVVIGWWWTTGRPWPDIDLPVVVTESGQYPDEVSKVGDSIPGSGPTSGNAVATDDSSIPGNAATPYNGMPSTGVVSYHDGIMKVAPSVVSLYATSSSDDATTGTRNPISQGSGVIVNADGVVLTNLHLVEGHDRISVVLSDGRNYPALLIGSDRETDLAVVRVAASNLPYVPLDDAPPLRVGDVVLAIGNPFGVGQTVTQGIVSATHRRVAGGSVWQHFVQIDAAINPGNSGGALINPYGQLVGVNTAVFRGDTGAVGIGFSIPADLLAQVVPQIIEHGSVARGWLGVAVEELSLFPKLARDIGPGAMIKQVLPDSPASRGGLQDMDIVTAINGQPVFNATQLLLAISIEPPGTPVSLTILRGEFISSTMDPAQTTEFETRELTLELGIRPEDPSAVIKPR